MITFLIHLAATLLLTGLVWFVQVIHYPLANQVGDDSFLSYQKMHMSRTGWLVAPLMLIELTTAIWLVMREKDVPEDDTLLWANLLLCGLIWASTFFVQMPLHQSLSKKRDEQKIRKLVSSNWLRTLLWSARSLLLLKIVNDLVV